MYEWLWKWKVKLAWNFMEVLDVIDSAIYYMSICLSLSVKFSGHWLVKSARFLAKTNFFVNSVFSGPLRTQPNSARVFLLFIDLIFKWFVKFVFAGFSVRFAHQDWESILFPSLFWNFSSIFFQKSRILFSEVCQFFLQRIIIKCFLLIEVSSTQLSTILPSIS